ncbi:hypothetical protein ACFX11_003199 [Malus domestica]
MAFQILKRTLSSARKPIPLSVSRFSSSSPPSEQAPSQTSPLISDVVSILTHQRSKSRWGYLHSLYPNGFNPDDFSKIALHIKNNPRLVLAFFLWTQRKSLCNHNLLSHSTIIHILARARLRSQAYDLIRAAIRVSDESEPLKVFESLVKTYRQCGSAPFVFDLLVKACLESKKIDPSIQIVRMLLSRGISPGLSICNALIRLLSQRRGAYAGYEIYREIFGLDCDVLEKKVKRVARISPSVQTFNALMLGFYQDGVVEKVKEIWDQMAGNIDSATLLYKDMLRKDFRPECSTMDALIQGLCDESRVLEALNVMRGATVDFGFCSTKKSYETLIRGLCEDEKLEEALKLQAEMVGKGFKPNSEVYHAFISGYMKQGNKEVAERLKIEMLDAQMCGNGD